MKHPFASSSTALTTRHATIFSATKMHRLHFSKGHRSISTLKKECSPSDERFINFYSRHFNPSRTDFYFRTRRCVHRQGVDYGTAELCISSLIPGHATTYGETLRLCPYYDPMTRTLRFQQLDGLDFSVVKPLAELIARKGCQPLLRLAHAESLIDKVPATELTSMDLAMIVASGYYMRAHRSANQSLLQGNIRIKGGHNTILMWWSSANEDHGRKYMDCFPFIDPQDDLLKMWDMEAKRAVAVSALKKTLMEPANGSNSVVGETKSETAARGARTISRGRLELDGFHANHVKQKWPGMYELIRKMGYWKDAESQTGTTT